MAEFVNALRDEIKALESDLRADPRFEKLESLREVLALYENIGMATERRTLEARPATRQPSEARANALHLAELYLRNRSGPRPTREIFEHIMENGARIGGKEPVNNLSAMLSNSARFQSHGRSGWTLAQSNEELLAELEKLAEMVPSDSTPDVDPPDPNSDNSDDDDIPF